MHFDLATFEDDRQRMSKRFEKRGRGREIFAPWRETEKEFSYIA